MNIVQHVQKLIIKPQRFSLEKLRGLQSDSSFHPDNQELTELVDSHLGYPNENALRLAYELPHKKYEAKLLQYQPNKMTDQQAILWMFTLGRIKSARGFEKILPFTNSSLFHHAYISLAASKLGVAFQHFEQFLDNHSYLYDPGIPTYQHDSGFNTLVYLLSHYKDKARQHMSSYDLHNQQKKALVNDALCATADRSR